MLLKSFIYMRVIRKNHFAKQIFQKKYHSEWKDQINISENVSQGIAKRIPMVALESTVLTHGMPWPINLQTAKSLEDIILNEHCIPVTIGVLHNVIKAGFSSEELEKLAKQGVNGQDSKKVSRRDLYNATNIKYGGTTVAATMIIAQKLGINIFATGGIGGVHRNFNDTMDVSADLRELGRTQICVVSSGIKSFLNISKTLEYLETEGVFVGTLGSEYFPGFFIKSSGIKSPYKIDNIEEAANIIYNMKEMNISSGMLLAVPIPASVEEEGMLIQNAIEKSIIMTKEMNISGSEVTPFLLKKVNEMTKGKSLELNVKLIKNNAMIGAKIAFQLNKMRKKISPETTNLQKETPSIFAVIGGSIVDNNLKLNDVNIKCFKDFKTQASYSCKSFQTSGGVGRNMAEVFSHLGEECYFLSAVGNDLSSEFLKKNSQNISWLRVKHVKDVETCNCSVIMLSDKRVLFHLGNFEIADHISLDYVKDHLSSIKKDLRLICLDSNLRQDVIELIFTIAKTNNLIVFVEPTDILLVERSLEALANIKMFPKPIDIISPNFSEFQYLLEILKRDKEKYSFDMNDKDWKHERSPFQFVQYVIQNSNLLDLIPKWIIKFGPDGVVYTSKEETFFIQQSKDFIRNEEVINVSGAGDCLAACALFLHYKVGLSWLYSIYGGIRIAKESLKSLRTVPTSIDPNNYLKNEIEKWTIEMLENKLLTCIK